MTFARGHVRRQEEEADEGGRRSILNGEDHAFGQAGNAGKIECKSIGDFVSYYN